MPLLDAPAVAQGLAKVQVLKKKFMNSWTKGKWIEVDLLTLPDINRRLGIKSPHVVKLDVEGYEFDVFDDLLKMPAMEQFMFELHYGGAQKWRESLAKIESAGFKVYDKELGRYFIPPHLNPGPFSPRQLSKAHATGVCGHDVRIPAC